MSAKRDFVCRSKRPSSGLWVAVAFSATMALPAAGALAGPCSHVAQFALRACRAEVQDDILISRAQCIDDEDDPAERAACFSETRDEKFEERALCREQYQARLDVCGQIGEARYNPDFDPADFVDPSDIGASVPANPYFPLVPGTRWVYQGGDETITVTVTAETKLIEGVTCVTVNDLVEEDGVAIEDTDDWYAQDLEGNVWYCGEIARNFEVFEGDDPEEPELVDIEGSWKTGRDGAKPGILMFANPQVGQVYRQEFALGDAEDMGEVVSVTGTESVPAAACAGDCVVTRDFTPIEPDADETKYYAPGVGLILEVDDEGARVELTEFTTP